jgi:MFS family permease
VRRTPALRIPLAMMVVAGIVSFNFQVLLPLLAAETWHGTAATYATLTAAMGVGSVLGALAAGARGTVTPQLLVGAAALFGGAELLVALAPSFELQALALVPMGAASVTFAAGVNSSLQLAAAPSLRGRVMSLYSIVFLGSTPIGAPAVGFLAEVAGPRSGLFAGAAAALAASVYARWAFARAERAGLSVRDEIRTGLSTGIHCRAPRFTGGPAGGRDPRPAPGAAPDPPASISRPRRSSSVG